MSYARGLLAFIIGVAVGVTLPFVLAAVEVLYRDDQLHPGYLVGEPEEGWDWDIENQ